jgi:hypothetical protein
MKFDAKEIIQKFRKQSTKYNEKQHCELLVEVMSNPEKATVCAFCVEAYIPEQTFYYWCGHHEIFGTLYSFCKMIARYQWEQDGLKIKYETHPIGQVSNTFEYWKMIGWSRFGIGKTSRIKLHLDPEAAPDKHYAQLLKQASEGDFTAAEIKQLMEAVNVGLNTHQAFALQKEIDALKSDLKTMQANTNAHNISTNKGIA